MNWNKALASLLVLSLLLGFGIYNDMTTPDNPFEEDPIIINSTYEEPAMPSYNAEINQSVAYWNVNSATYGNWSANLSYQPNATNADITIHFVTEINRCGANVAQTGVFTGCSDLIDKGMDIDHSTLKIVAYRPSEALRETIKHELGHIHGITHKMLPKPLMNATKERAY